MHLLLKTLITALIVVAVSEVARRHTLMAAVLASLPLTSVLAFIWLYVDTHDTARISALSYDIFWMVLPSLLLFISLPMLLKSGISFPLSLLASCAITAVGYAAFLWIKSHVAF